MLFIKIWYSVEKKKKKKKKKRLKHKNEEVTYCTSKLQKYWDLNLKNT